MVETTNGSHFGAVALPPGEGVTSRSGLHSGPAGCRYGRGDSGRASTQNKYIGMQDRFHQRSVMSSCLICA